MSTSRGLVFSAIPFGDESFVGYITRLTEANHYDNPSWIFQMARLGTYVKKEGLAFRGDRDLNLLSGLTGIETSELIALTYKREGIKKMDDCLIFGQFVPRTALRLNPAKICPHCLREFGYVRRIWDLKIVTTCPLHKCLLLDECPNCRRTLPVLRSRLNACKCQYDWRDYYAQSVDEKEIELTQRAHALCGLTSGLHMRDSESLSALNLSQLLSVVSLITSEYQRRERRVHDLRFRPFKGMNNNSEIHRILCKAISVFRDWPHNYYAFLDSRSDHQRSKNKFSGIHKDFSGFASALDRHRATHAFDFMREAFATYLKVFWTGGYASRRSGLKDESRTYMSKAETSKILSVAADTVDRLIRTGQLKPIIKYQRRGRIILIDANDVAVLKAERASLIDRQQAARRLGINTIQTQALVRAGLLAERDAYDRRSEAFYNVYEIDALVLKTATVRKRVRLNPKSKTIGFGDALYYLACHHDISVTDFVQAIIVGAIKPCDVTDSPGFRSLQFLRRDVVAYRETIFRQRYPDALNTFQAAKVLRVHPKIIRFLIRRRLLQAKRVRWHLAISLKAISDFASRFVLTQALAKEFHTSTRYLTNILEMEGIRAIPDSIVHHKPSYCVFKRNDVDRMNLAELIEAKREGVTSQSPLFNIASAAEFLNVKSEILSQLITNGVLTPPTSGKRKRPEQDYFTARHLQRFAGKIEKYVGLVTAKIAAAMFGRSVSNFNERLVKANALAVVHVDGDHRRFFRKRDAEELAAKMKNLVGAADVRATLKLGETQLMRLTESGELKPVSGPNVDGFGHNLFSKHDVEIVRRQRELFKRKRARDGGSQRFGKPAGPRRRPVVEAITPRVSELMNEAAVKGSRISGATIHKQLAKEGYCAGIVSVYVCLRTLRDSAKA